MLSKVSLNGRHAKGKAIEEHIHRLDSKEGSDQITIFLAELCNSYAF